MTNDRSEYNKQWRKDNADHVKEYNKKYYQEKGDFKRDLYKKWSEQNQPYLLEYRKRYYQDNKDNVKERRKEHYQENRTESLTKHRVWIEENREHRDKQHKEYIEKYNTKRRELINSIKIRFGCYYCNERDPIVLDFHHLDPSTKLFTIGQKIFRSLDPIITEIRKCICICANCHRRLHAKTLVLPNIDLVGYHR